jgi:NTE family protein
MLGLVLTAGGARGAYQAGVLKRLVEVPSLRHAPAQFAIVTGASAGAINGTMLAARSADFHDATAGLADIWCRLEMNQVVRTDLLSLATTGVGFLRDLTLGSLLGHTVTHGLLDASPLRSFLDRVLPMAGIADAIQSGHLHAVAITATSYHSGRSFTFVQGRPGHAIWQKSRRVVLPVELTAEHVCASSAIPLVFPPVRIATPAGDLHFGDGALRLVTPFSPAIRLGASHVFAVGVRSPNASDALSREELATQSDYADGRHAIASPPLAQICGVFMNAIFLDHLDTDLDHLVRMNELIESQPPRVDVAEPMRPISPLVVSPSEDLALVARDFADRMPRLLRLALETLGTPDAQSADLMSYLLFDSAFTGALVDIGYRDADLRIDEIEEFLLAARDATEDRPALRARRLRLRGGTD